jgi:hypothetical protein
MDQKPVHQTMRDPYPGQQQTQLGSLEPLYRDHMSSNVRAEPAIRSPEVTHSTLNLVDVPYAILAEFRKPTTHDAGLQRHDTERETWLRADL